MQLTKILKTISLILVVSLLTEELSFAAGEIKPAVLNLFEKPQLSLKFPDCVAQIEDSYEQRAPSDERLIYLIADAHTNTSGQENLSKTIDILLNHDRSLKYIFSEAARDNNSLSHLRTQVPLRKRQQIANKYLKQGLLHGEEYLDLTSDKPFILWGVENQKLYLRSLSSYRRVAKNRDRFENYLDRINQAITTLKPRIYNPSLLELDQIHEKFLKEEISLTDYIEKLNRGSEYRSVRVSKGQSVRVSEFYPHLQALKALKNLEQQINFQKANEEQIKAILSLSKDNQKELLEYRSGRPQGTVPTRISSNDHKEEQAFYALLESVILNPAKQGEGSHHDVRVSYPNLSLYFQYLKQANAINPQAVLKEQKELENQLFLSLASTPDEQTLLKCQTQLRLLKKLFNLKLTPEEYKEYKDANLDIRHLTGFLNKKIMDLHQFYERVSFLEEGFDPIVRESERFYELTIQRDEKFVENMLSVIARSEATKQSSVLITGGFHTTNLKSLLKSRNISYISITPQVYQETNQKRYEDILLGQKRHSKLFVAIPTSVSTMNFPRARANMVTDTGVNSALIKDFTSLRFQEVEKGARLAEEERSPDKRRWFQFTALQMLIMMPSVLGIVLLLLSASWNYQFLPIYTLTAIPMELPYRLLVGWTLLLSSFYFVHSLARYKKFSLKKLVLALVSLGFFLDNTIPVRLLMRNSFGPEGDRVTDYSVKRLREMGPAALSELTKALRDEYSTNRWLAVHALRKMGRSALDAIPVLAGNLKDEDLATKVSALAALQKIDPSGTQTIVIVGQVLRDASSGNIVNRGSALKFLKNLGTSARPAMPDVQYALKDPILQYRRDAVSILGNIGDASAIPYLQEMLKNPQNRYFESEINAAINKLEAAKKKAKQSARLAVEEKNTRSGFFKKAALAGVLVLTITIILFPYLLDLVFIPKLALKPDVQAGYVTQLEHGLYYQRRAAVELLIKDDSRGAVPALLEKLTPANTQISEGAFEVLVEKTKTQPGIEWYLRWRMLNILDVNTQAKIIRILNQSDRANWVDNFLWIGGRKPFAVLFGLALLIFGVWSYWSFRKKMKEPLKPDTLAKPDLKSGSGHEGARLGFTNFVPVTSRTIVKTLVLSEARKALIQENREALEHLTLEIAEGRAENLFAILFDSILQFKVERDVHDTVRLVEVENGRSVVVIEIQDAEARLNAYRTTVKIQHNEALTLQGLRALEQISNLGADMAAAELLDQTQAIGRIYDLSDLASFEDPAIFRSQAQKFIARLLRAQNTKAFSQDTVFLKNSGKLRPGYQTEYFEFLIQQANEKFGREFIQLLEDPQSDSLGLFLVEYLNVGSLTELPVSTDPGKIYAPFVGLEGDAELDWYGLTIAWGIVAKRLAKHYKKGVFHRDQVSREDLSWADVSFLNSKMQTPSEDVLEIIQVALVQEGVTILQFKDKAYRLPIARKVPIQVAMAAARLTMTQTGLAA